MVYDNSVATFPFLLPLVYPFFKNAIEMEVTDQAKFFLQNALLFLGSTSPILAQELINAFINFTEFH